MRFSLRLLLAAFLVIGVASASLVSYSEFAPNLMFTIAAGSLLFFSLHAIVAQKVARAFGIGYLIFAGGYLALVIGPFREQVEPAMVTTTALNQLRSWVSKEVETDTFAVPDGAQLIGKNVPIVAGDSPKEGDGNASEVGTTDSAGGTMAGGLDGMGGGMMGGMGAGGMMGGSMMGGGGFRTAYYVVVPHDMYFKRAGHSLLAVLFGILGGCLGRYMYSQYRGPDNEPD